MSLFTPSPHPTTSSKPKPKPNTPPNTPQGFTIVELLIVIVVIAILAAISVVAYNGVQERAKNVAMTSAAGQTKKLLDLYVAANGALPATGTMCATVDNKCSVWSTNSPYTTNNATFITMLRTVGEPLASAPASGHINQANYGIRYDNNGTQRMLIWSLQGESQNCDLSVVQYNDRTTPSTTGYTSNYTADQGARTLCIVRLD